MIIFPVVIIISIFMYLYYKIMIANEPEPLKKEIKNAKARIALGVFISFFGINQYLFYETQLSLFITIIFLFFGIMQGYAGYKRLSHYKKEYQKRVEVGRS
ncbi:YtpI family protein [Gracilibacillus sp. S3-1-1]|uniref:YtpI family protein n=1 Tax=Gracilibacillus pellucidus TaxID=3095368 RepID=A0ACC6M7G6_9BACI|nr:YtpI family protein [Gracilibacillus sp. S3-1-1]MDX8046707.1 YtpI family protein [Gracilibacillus sp. S3-1-1]